MHIDFTGCPWWCLLSISLLSFTWSFHFGVLAANKVFNWRLNRIKLEKEVQCAVFEAEAAKTDKELSELKLKMVMFKKPQPNARPN